MVRRVCAWAGDDPLMRRYHDEEWGVPVHDDRTLFEFLILEGAQAGLSWSTILRKRESYRAAFAGFDPARVARFDARRRAVLLRDPGIVRNRLKIEAAVSNARAYLDVQREYGSFDRYLWGFVEGAPIRNRRRAPREIPSRTAESDALSAGLRRRGFRFVGSTIAYAFMQAVGMVNDHQVSCFRWREVAGRARGRGAGLLLALGLLCAAPHGAALAAGAGSAARALDFEYVSPIPGSRYHRPTTDIIIRPGGRVDPATVDPDRLFLVTGDESGRHEGRAALSDDGETITFRPARPFAPGETVHCAIRPGLRTDARGGVRPVEFSFTVAGAEAASVRGPPLEEMLDMPPGGGAAGAAPLPGVATPARSAALDSLPGDFPTLTRTVPGPSSPGMLFLSNFSFSHADIASYLMIVSDDGVPAFYRKVRSQAFDFKLQPNGLLTYYDWTEGLFYALNAAGAVVDSFRCGNGYLTDIHDLQILPNGHALLLGDDLEPVDMSAVAPGGDPGATVMGLIVQELDRKKEVVFEWRSWDHFQITDAAADIDLTGKIVDYVHGNAIEPDADGNLLLSSRHMDEITKINRRTGAVMWRWGGRRNQFTFVNDPTGFSHQHDIRRLPNGDVTLFDNGNGHVPQFSRAVEYRLDERRRTATQVWEYRSATGQVAYAMGNVQRLPDGNTLIGWGTSIPTLTEVTPDGTAVSVVTFDWDIFSYRAFRFPWPPVLRVDAAVTPDVVNPKAPGRPLALTIQADAFDPGLIDAGTVLLGGVAPADPVRATRGTRHGAPALQVEFDTADLAPLLHPGANSLAVTGRMATGATIRGEVEIRVVGAAGAGAREGEGARPRLVSVPGRLPVRVRLSGDVGGAGPSLSTTVSVYDARGRLVKRWRAAVGDDRTVEWNGRATDGTEVRSGVYFVCVGGVPAATRVKVVVVR